MKRMIALNKLKLVRNKKKIGLEEMKERIEKTKNPTKKIKLIKKALESFGLDKELLNKLDEEREKFENYRFLKGLFASERLSPMIKAYEIIYRKMIESKENDEIKKIEEALSDLYEKASKFQAVDSGMMLANTLVSLYGAIFINPLFFTAITSLLLVPATIETAKALEYSYLKKYFKESE